MATKQEIRDYFAKFGRKGGQATARKLTPERRSEIARKAAEARWKKLNDTVDRIEAGAKRLKKQLDAGARKRKKKES